MVGSGRWELCRGPHRETGKGKAEKRDFSHISSLIATKVPVLDRGPTVLNKQRRAE